MSTIIMNAVWPFQMEPSAKMVLVSLADNANDHGYCWPAIAKIAMRTCLSERTVIRAIKFLESKGYLTADRSNGRKTTYVINVGQDEPVTPCHPGRRVTPDTVSPNPCHHVTKPVTPCHPNHKEPSRTTNKADDPVPLPDWLPVNAWHSYLSMRKELKKPASAEAQQLAIKRLAEFRQQGHNVTTILENSILNGWTGVFAPKDKFKNDDDLKPWERP